MKTCFALVFSLLLLSCNNASNTKEEAPIPDANSSVHVEQKDSMTAAIDSVPQNIQVDSVIHLSFPTDSVSITVKGHVDKKGNPVICYLPVTKGSKLTASVVPDNTKATIRFSHLYLPDGKSDGPFGNTLKYALRQKGTYKLYIGPNKMAGDPFSTDFILKIKVE
ncbi:hypothetical protein [Terrimonas pollutisoli]|uniref:hypothetical protein n=1 Tax=Terrimonas pollutisoli TaxID=3034147 RepID=UPI0023EC263A|nr:hypothetical protein [Terrimonas sp. H1YJ31]